MTLLLVALGGALGSVMRYELAGRTSDWTASDWHGTLLVNVVGSLLIGFIVALTESRDLLSGSERAGLIAGVLGGFTTFSALAYQSYSQLEAGDLAAAFANIALSLSLGLAAVWAGVFAGRHL